MIVVFIAPVFRLINNVVSEKQAKVRELMRIMGLTDAPYWLSWFTYYVVLMTIICFVMSLILLGVFKYSNFLLTYAYLWLYSMALFSYSIFIASFFSNSKVASIAGTMILFFSSYIILINGNPKNSVFSKHLFSILPNISMQLMSPILFDFEN